MRFQVQLKKLKLVHDIALAGGCTGRRFQQHT